MERINGLAVVRLSAQALPVVELRHAPRPAVKADAETEAAVLATMDRFIEGYANRDVQSITGLYAPDDDVLLFGTGPDEKRVGLAEIKSQLERDFSQTEAAAITLERAKVWARGPVAWMAVETIISWETGGSEFSIPLRWTIVLEKRNEKWLWVHSHTSITAGQSEGQSFPTAMEAVASAVSSERPDLRLQASPDGTVTMLFTDIENSTAIAERLGDRRWLEVLREHNAITREQIGTHGCFEVKSQGDGFMIASQSARRGVQCAIDIQRAFAQRNETAEDQIRVRIGLHTGEALKDADDFFGKHVILASRIAGQAEGGEILASSLLKDLTDSLGDIPFGESREAELKGLTGVYRMYVVDWQD
jgi:class 3 adenylate cyclase/ketosteroid isomerase-like protein